jgi:glycosyltransferase involved in cell wall biosynthesis
MNSKPLPFFTVIVPTHSRPMLLRRALSSIKSQATSVPFQVIVVCDKVSSETSAACDDLLSDTDMFIRRDPCKVADSRNAALPFAKGKYILFLDDDDAWHPNFLENLYNQPAVQQGQLVYTDCSRVIERRDPQGPQFISEDGIDMTGRVNELIYVRNQSHMSTIAFPRTLLWGLQFDPLLRTFEDWEFLLGVFDRAMPVHVPVLGSRIYEVHDDTTDRLSNQAFDDYGGVLDYLYIYRRRPAPTEQLRQIRADMLKKVGLGVDAGLL